MLVFLLTLHGYATWMPDRPEGSFHWQRGYQEPDDHLADCYRRNQREATALFDARVQRVMLDELLVAAPAKALVLYAAATDDSHLHALVGWHDDGRTAERVQDRVKHSLTQKLNLEVGRRTWFTRNGHRRPVADRGHFDHLRDTYLPAHPGWKWDRRCGFWLVGERRASGTLCRGYEGGETAP